MLLGKGGITAVSACVNNQPALCRVMLSDFNIATQIDFVRFIFKAKCSQKTFQEWNVSAAEEPAGWAKAAPGSHPGVRARGEAPQVGCRMGIRNSIQQALTSWFDLQFPITSLGPGLCRPCL